jgi:flagellar biogenesis protein FliO
MRISSRIGYEQNCIAMVTFVFILAFVAAFAFVIERLPASRVTNRMAPKMLGDKPPAFPKPI